MGMQARKEFKLEHTEEEYTQVQGQERQNARMTRARIFDDRLDLISVLR